MNKIKFLFETSKTFACNCLLAFAFILFTIEDFANGYYIWGAIELFLVVRALSHAKDEYDEIK